MSKNKRKKESLFTREFRRMMDEHPDLMIAGSSRIDGTLMCFPGYTSRNHPDYIAARAELAAAIRSKGHR
jgi:hypothetical protein